MAGMPKWQGFIQNVKIGSLGSFKRGALPLTKPHFPQCTIKAILVRPKVLMLLAIRLKQ